MYEFCLTDGNLKAADELRGKCSKGFLETPMVRARECLARLRGLAELLNESGDPAKTYEDAVGWLKEAHQTVSLADEYAGLHLHLRTQAVLAPLRKGLGEWRAGKKVVEHLFPAKGSTKAEKERKQLLLNVLEQAQRKESAKVTQQLTKLSEAPIHSALGSIAKAALEAKLPRPKTDLIPASFYKARKRPVRPAAKPAAAPVGVEELDDDGDDAGEADGDDAAADDDDGFDGIAKHVVKDDGRVKYQFLFRGEPSWAFAEKYSEYAAQIAAYNKKHKIKPFVPPPPAAEEEEEEEGDVEEVVAPPPTKSNVPAAQPPAPSPKRPKIRNGAPPSRPPLKSASGAGPRGGRAVGAGSALTQEDLNPQAALSAQAEEVEDEISGLEARLAELRRQKEKMQQAAGLAGQRNHPEAGARNRAAPTSQRKLSKQPMPPPPPPAPPADSEEDDANFKDILAAVKFVVQILSTAAAKAQK